MMTDQDRLIRASEVGQYVYCARAWWLGDVLGYQSAHGQEMAAGHAAHRLHGRAVAGYHQLQHLAYLCLVMAGLVAVVLLMALRAGS